MVDKQHKNNGNTNGNGHRRGWRSLLFGRDNPRSSLHSYRRLGLQLDADLGDSATGRAVMLTATHSQELIHQTTLGLAKFLSGDLGQRVLIIDASIDSPGVTAELGHRDAPGLTDILRDSTKPITDLLVSAGSDRMQLLPAGQSGDTPLPKLTLQKILADAREKADYVLIQTGPLLDDARALAFAPWVDRVLLLAIEGETMLEDLDAGYDMLLDCHAKNVGLVLTKLTGSRLIGR